MLCKTLKKDVTYILNTENVVTIGGFDGVHLGHQVVLKTVVNIAKERNIGSLAVTFHPLPKVFFDVSSKTKEILDLKSKEKAILQLGINHLYALKFYTEFTKMEAKYFLNEFLIGSLNTKILVVGYNFRFGKERKVGVVELKKIIRDIPNFELVVVPKIETPEGYPNSTQIRQLLEEKEYQKASKLLGWDYEKFKSSKEIIFKSNP